MNKSTKQNTICFNFDEISSASGGLRPWPGALPLTSLGAKPPDSHYRLALAISPPFLTPGSASDWPATCPDLPRPMVHTVVCGCCCWIAKGVLATKRCARTQFIYRLALHEAVHFLEDLSDRVDWCASGNLCRELGCLEMSDLNVSIKQCHPVGLYYECEQRLAVGTPQPEQISLLHDTRDVGPYIRVLASGHFVKQ